MKRIHSGYQVTLGNAGNLWIERSFDIVNYGEIKEKSHINNNNRSKMHHSLFINIALSLPLKPVTVTHSLTSFLSASAYFHYMTMFNYIMAVTWFYQMCATTIYNQYLVYRHCKYSIWQALQGSEFCKCAFAITFSKASILITADIFSVGKASLFGARSK